MKKFTTRVLAERNGSRYAVVGSGNSDMSDSWMAWKPRMDEPSKLSPSSKTDWSNDDTGTVKCCMMPGRSQKRTSIISTPLSLTYLSSSSLFWNIRPPWLRHVVQPEKVWEQSDRSGAAPGDVRNVCTGSFSTVSGLFQACNRWSVTGPVGPRSTLTGV